MDLFYTDQEAIQIIEELSEQEVCALPYYEEEEAYQWIFKICKVEPIARKNISDLDLVHKLLDSVGLGGRNLWEVKQEEAAKILFYVLSQSLAYSNITVLQEKNLAIPVMQHILCLFSSRPRYFTNGRFNSHPFCLSSWDPCSSHTYDTGLLLLDEQRIGVLWATDED